MSTIDEKLNEVLDIAEEVFEGKKEVAIVPSTTPKNTDPDVDFETGRENLYKLLAKGNEAIDGILSLAKEGVNIAICARNEEKLHNAVNEIKSKTKVEVIPIVADLSDVNNIKEKIVDKVLQEFGSIDILLINSGGPKPGVFSDFSSDDWDISYHMVLKYVVELYKHIIPIMKNNKWGRIINVTSVSVKEPLNYLVLSNSIRSAVVAWAKSLSVDVGKDGVTVNSILTGYFDTERIKELNKEKSKSLNISEDEVLEKMKSLVPINRLGKTEEYGFLVSFLSSDKAAYINGASIPIDGGLLKSY